MQATNSFPWWIEVLRWYLLAGVPLMMLVIVVDSLRRSDTAFKHGRVEKLVFVIVSVASAALLAAGMKWPHVALLGLVAILLIPLSFFYGAAYLLRVVYRIPEPAAAPAPEAGTVPSSDPTEES